MPKPPPVETFNVTFFGVPKELLGETVAAQAKLGDFPYRTELVTTVAAFRNNARPEGTPGVNTAEFVAKWVEDNPTFKAIECVKALKEATGNGGTAVYPALKVLVEKGILKKLGEGNYAHAAVKHLAAPKKIARERHEVDHREFILRYARQHQGRMSVSKLKAHFEKHDRKANSVSGAINILVANKKIKALGDGEYVLLIAAAKKQKPKPPVNGTNNNATPVEEVANG
jgi:hypothetical protein